MKINTIAGRAKGVALSATGRTGVMTALAGLTATPALAQSYSAGNAANTLSTQFTNFGNLLVNGCFLVGIGTAGSGIWEMKKAGDDNARGEDSHKSGFIKILAGGGLAAVPMVTGMGIATVFNGQTNQLEEKQVQFTQ